MGSLVYIGCETRERALEVRRMLYRSAGHFKVSLHAPVVQAPDGTYQITFTVYTKSAGRKSVLERYGPDRSAWPFDPRATKKDAA
jgi:hypothetical protein